MYVDLPAIIIQQINENLVKPQHIPPHQGMGEAFVFHFEYLLFRFA